MSPLKSGPSRKAARSDRSRRSTAVSLSGQAPAVAVSQLTLQYPGADKPAVDSVSFTVDRGEFIYLVGSSGSGKSSLLRMMYAEVAPTSGRLQVAGISVGRLRASRKAAYRRNIGVVFQDFKLLEGRTVAEQVAFALTVTGQRAAIPTRVPEVLELVGLSDKATRVPTELSGGEQQRVAIARALATGPQILFADEPTGNLDPVTSAQVTDALAAVNAAGVTVVMATHDVGLVDATGHRVLVMEGGHLVRDDIAGGYHAVEMFTVTEKATEVVTETVTETVTVTQTTTEAVIEVPAVVPAGADEGNEL